MFFYACMRGSYKGSCGVETIFTVSSRNTTVMKDGDLLENCDMKTVCPTDLARARSVLQTAENRI